MSNATTHPTKISIIVVSLNNSKADICSTLDSISQQDYPNKEIVVIDGGSGPETISALRNYSGLTGYFCSEKDNGIYDAMNKGLKHAGGKWITFMNIGDLYNNANSLSDMLSAVAGTDIPLVFGDAAVSSNGSIAWTEQVPLKLTRGFLFGGMVCHQAILASQDAFRQVGDFNTSYSVLADKEWLLRFLKLDLESRHCGRTVCRWAMGGTSSLSSRLDSETARLKQESYSPLEIPVYMLYWVIKRAQRRLRLCTSAIFGRRGS